MIVTWSLRRTFRSPKVPEIDAAFWVLKLLTTAMGEATSDYLVHRFNPELAVLVSGVVFAIALINQLRAPRYLVGAYWLTVVMVSVFGTMCADVTHVALKVPYAVSSATFATALLVVFVSWQRVERTLSIHSVTTARRELFYWATVTATFALGTALGDLTATTFGLGYLTAGLIFAGLYALPGLGYRFANWNAIGAFWAAYVLTRPFGASFADYMGKTRVVGGLGWGPGTVSLLFSALIAVGVAGLLVRQHATDRARSPLA